ncbi:Fc.00g016710.m01.CDS01 [Cosmosporella sp. VM-42]
MELPNSIHSRCDTNHTIPRKRTRILSLKVNPKPEGPIWDKLPAEIKSMVFDDLAETLPNFKREFRFFTTVSREWRDSLESYIFQHITLYPHQLVGFQWEIETNRRRLHYIRHICLRVKLPEYGYETSRTEEDQAIMNWNNGVLATMLGRLLPILALSAGDDPQDRGGLTLELCAYSPSDSKYRLRDFRLDDEYRYQSHEENKIDPDDYTQYHLDKKVEVWRRLLNGWPVNPIYHPDLEVADMKRFFGSPLAWDAAPGSLPRVTIVEGLLIRRQFYRSISMKTLSQLFRESFVNIKWFRYEKWRPVDQTLHHGFQQGLIDYFLHDIPRTLEKLHLFQDHTDKFDRWRRDPGTTAALGKAMARNTRHLEELSGCFVVDAKDFFFDFWPNRWNTQRFQKQPEWTNLRSLVLTSRMLVKQTRRRDRVNDLLASAGAAALYMPKLQVLEIFYGNVSSACIFSFSRASGCPVITWRSNWHQAVNGQVWHKELQLLPIVIESWRRAAAKHSWGPMIDVRKQPLPQNAHTVNKTYIGIVIPRLELRSQIFHPQSLYQLEWEIEHGETL